MKNIIVISTNLGYGGASKILISVINHLSTKYKITILNFGDYENFYNLSDKVVVKNYSSRKSNRHIVIKIFETVFKFMIIYIARIKNKAEIILTFDNLEKLLINFACIGTKTKTIISERKDPYSYKENKLNYMHFRYAISDGVVFQSEQAFKYFSEVCHNYEVIPNFVNRPIEITKFSSRESSIIHVGRFDVKAKRQDLMVEAFRHIHKVIPNIKLYFYGGFNGYGEDSNYVNYLVKKYNLTNSVFFMGKSDNIMSELMKFKYFCFTSDYEGVPNALLEAMACGLAIITTNFSPGSGTDIINNGVNGFVIERNNPLELAGKVLELYNNPQLAETIAINARRTSFNYDKLLILDKWMNYVDRIFSEKKQSIFKKMRYKVNEN